MKRFLVVVYSHTGTSRRLAEQLCSQQGWQMAEIADAQPRRGLPGSTAFTAREVDDGSCAIRLRFVGAAVRGAEASHAAARQALSSQAP